MIVQNLNSRGSHLFYYRDIIEKEIAKSISSFGERTKLRDACEYALTNGGKRLRPLLVLMIAEALEKGFNVSPAALSVEFFHTASLIADDLPCMDNDEERRDKPSVHKIYGETVALLASYALITAGFEKIHQNAALMPGGIPENDRICVMALECATHCSGILGATGGQFLDLFPPQNMNLEILRKMVYRKTVTLFEVSFVFGWLFGGGDPDRLSDIKTTAYHLGMAFQIADDIKDLDQDSKKSSGANIARFIGKERAHLLFEEEMQHFEKGLRDLSLSTPSFDKLCQLLRSYYT